MEGKLIVARLSQADGQLKSRPALILRNLRPFDDFLVCGVSSQLRHAVVGFDEIIASEDMDFIGSGLRVSSLIRLGYLAVLPQNQVVGDIGTVSPERYRRLLQRLSDFFRPA